MLSKSLFSIGRWTKGAVGVIALTAALLALPEQSRATTVAGAAVANTVTVGWQSTGGQAYSATSTVTVTVNLVHTAPTLAFVSEVSDARLVANAVDEATSVTMTYGVYATNNGPVNYTFNAPTYGNTTIGVPTTGSLTSFNLGASSVAYPAAVAAGQKTFYVPYDGTKDGFIGGTSGFSVDAGNNTIQIGANRYTIATITEDTSADGGLPADYKGKFAKITLVQDLVSPLTPGDQVGQYKEVSFTVTTGTIVTPSPTGLHQVTVTAKDDAANTSNSVGPFDINVARCVLTISKTVSVDDGANYVPTSATSDPRKELRYRILVSNSTNKACNNVSITDVLSPYVAYLVGDPVFTQGAIPSTLDYTSATKTYNNQINASFTPNGTVGSNGGAPVNYDANVSSYKIAFTQASTMAGNSSFTLDYRVWLY